MFNDFDWQIINKPGTNISLHNIPATMLKKLLSPVG